MNVDLSTPSKHRKLKKTALVIWVAFIEILLQCLFIPFLIIYVCVDGLLQLVYGHLYGGLLNGYDLLFEAKNQKGVMNIILVLSYKDEPMFLIRNLKDCALQMHQSSFKFSSIIRNLLGYRYFVKNQINYEEIFTVVRYDNNEYMTRENLVDYLEKNCIILDDNKLWKTVVFSQPIIWNSHADNKQLAVVLSFRHAIGDFPSIISFVKKHFQLREIVCREDIKRDIQEVDLNLDNICALRNPLLPLAHNIPFKIPNNIDPHITMYVEENTNLMARLKRIKQKYSASISDIFTSTFIMSIREYAIQRGIQLVDISVGNVVRQFKSDRSNIINGTYNFEKLDNKLGARFCTVSLEEHENVEQILLHQRRYNSKLATSVDDCITSVASADLITFLPVGLINFIRLALKFQPSLGVSNIVGLPKSKCCGYTVDDIVFFAPVFFEIGFVFFINSYAGRMQMVLTSKEGCVHNRQELQSILNNILKYIDELGNETV